MKSYRSFRNSFAAYAAILPFAPSVSIAEIIGLDYSINAAAGEIQAEFVVDMGIRVAEVAKVNRNRD